MSQDLASFLDSLRAPTHTGKTPASGSGTPVNPKMTDPTTKPEEREKLFEEYTSALMGTPQSSWNDAEQRAIAQAIQTVLKRDGY